MKKLMKLMTAFAVMAFACGALAQSAYVKELTPDFGKSQIVYTNVIDVGGDVGYKALEKVIVANASSVTVSNLIQAVDLGDVYTFLATNAAAAGANVTSFPERTVAWGDVTSTLHTVRDVRILTYLVGTNGVAKTDALSVSVYSK